MVELSLFASIPLSTAPAPFRRGVCINHTRDMLCQNPPWPLGFPRPKTEAAGVHDVVPVPSRSLFSRPALQRRPNPCPFLSPIRASPPLPPCACPVLTTCQKRSSKRRDVCMRHDWQNTATTSHTQRRIAKGVYRCSSLHREACCRCLLRTTANAPSCCRTERSAQSRLRGSRSAIGSWTSARRE